MDFTRRSFFASLWAAALAALAVVLRPGEAAAKKVAIDLAKLPGLGEVGGSAIVSIKKKKILFIRVSAKSVVALKPVCSHQKCAVQYKKKWGEIRCACHGSKFTTKGKVQTGPADKDLTTYPARIEDGKVIVTL
jgi:Rieske Fe-S protein